MAPSAADVRAARHGVYERGVLVGDDGEVPVLPHGLERVDTDGLAALTAAEDARAVLEVGAGVGVGTLALCEGLLERGGGALTVVDPFAFGGDVAVHVLRDAGVEEMVTRVREASQIVMPRMVAEGRRFDLAVVDGGHRFDEVFLDLVYADQLLEPGRVVVVDDLWMAAIRMAVSYLERNLGYVLEPDALPEGWRRTPSIKPGSRRSAGRVAVLRKPLEAPERDWDHFGGFET